jgi:secreted trypsin-like serine protease
MALFISGTPCFIPFVLWCFVSVAIGHVHASKGAGVIEGAVKRNKTGFIMNGASANRLGDYPFFVQIVHGSRLCGGTLIAPDIVLTAAHCINSTDPSNYVVYTTDNENRFTVTHSVTGVSAHPLYRRGTIMNDIGLLFVDGFVQQHMRQVQLAQLNLLWPGTENEYVIAIGTGATQHTANAEELQQVGAKVLSNALCQQYFPEFDPSIMICVSGFHAQTAAYGKRTWDLVETAG